MQLPTLTRSMKITLAACVVAVLSAHILTACLRAYAAPTDIAARVCNAARQNYEGVVHRLAAPSLKQLWDDAQDHNDAIAAAKPDEKPPLGDGIPLTAFPDYAPSCVAGAVNIARTAASVDMHYIFPDNPTGGWTDRLILRRDGGRWLVDDILYGPDWRFGLRRALSAAAKS